MKLVSACLMGINCKYDGKNNLNKKIINLNKKEILIPVCPEQLGGLPTPRIASEQRDGRVYSKSEKDLTNYFINGAEEVLRLTKLYKIKEAILKQRSPSCGCGQIYDGTFNKVVVKGDGITTALLKRNGIEVITEEDL